MAFNGSTLTFDTIADLRQQVGTPNTRVNVLGYYTSGDGGGGEFYWDNVSTDTDNNGTIFQVTGVATGRWIRTVQENTINVKWFGAKGDYNLTTGTDDTTLIELAIAYVTLIKTATFKPTLYFPETLGYLITSTITIPNGIHVIMKTGLVYNGPATSGALVIGVINNSNAINFEIRLSQRFIPLWTDTNITDNNFGVKFINLLNTTSGYIPSVSFFCNNIIFEGNGTTIGGFAYNTITIGSSIDAINHLTIQNLGTIGWVNENSFISGNFQNSSSTSSRATDRHGVIIKTSSPFVPNNNHFYKPCFQLGYSGIPDPNINNSIPIWIQQGNSNFFHDIRSENSGNTVMQTDGTSNGNYVHAGLMLLSGVGTPLIDNSDARNNFVENDVKKRISTGDTTIFDSGFIPEKINKYDASRWYIPGVSWTRSTDAVIYAAGSGLTITSDYIQIGSSERLGVFIDTTVAKKFGIKWDVSNNQGGRILLRIYDSSGNIITPTPSPMLVSPTNTYGTILSTYGGVYSLGSDSTGKYIFFAVDTSVTKVFVGLSGGTQPLLLKSFQISSLDGVLAAVNSGLDRKFGEFGVANIIPTEIKPKGTIIYNDLSVSSTPLGWQNTDGATTWIAMGGGGVTSVDMSVPSVFNISGNPITTSGTLAITFATGQTQNQVLASPNGSSGAIGLRALVATDIPFVDASKITSGVISASNLPTAIADGTTKGISTFTAADFNDVSGLISIDYTNAQKATSSVPGLMSTANQSFAGIKTFTGDVLVPGCAVSGKLGVGTGTTVPTSANIFSVNTTLPQIKGGYDTSNFWTIQAGSTGSTTFALAGTTPIFIFSSPVNITSGVSLPISAAKTANYTAVSSDYTIQVDSTSGDITITLPTSGIQTGQIYNLKKIVVVNSMIIDPNGAATIDGSATLTITAQWENAMVQFDGTNYIRL